MSEVMELLEGYKTPGRWLVVSLSKLGFWLELSIYTYELDGKSAVVIDFREHIAVFIKSIGFAA